MSCIPQPHPVELDDTSFPGSNGGRNRSRQMRRGKACCREGSSHQEWCVNQARKEGASMWSSKEKKNRIHANLGQTVSALMLCSKILKYC